MKAILMVMAWYPAFLMGQLKDPVQWHHEVKKLGDQMYEIRLTAAIQKGWHIYTQHVPPRAIAFPTAIKLQKNPLISVKGKTEEKGRFELKREDITEVQVGQYRESALFLQQISLKKAVKTVIAGTIEYMACTDEMCLPTKTLPFSIKIE